MTNFEHIRQMDDEAFAEFINDLSFNCHIQRSHEYCKCFLNKGVMCDFDSILEWLREDYDGE